jgi:hypothetical protein
LNSIRGWGEGGGGRGVEVDRGSGLLLITAGVVLTDHMSLSNAHSI